MTHVKNAEAFSRLVDFCTGYGGTYNPGRPTLQINALNDQKAKTADALNHVIDAKSHYDNQVNQRKQQFDQLPRLAASIMRTLEASGASKEKLDDARAYAQRITGKSSKGNAPSAPAPANAVATPAATVAKGRPHSTMQLSYAAKADAFAKLITTVSSEPLYVTNEANLNVAALTDRLAEMNQANQNVSGAQVAWSNSLIDRNDALYNQALSMYRTAGAVKKYVRALFGPNSEQYARVKSLSFTKPAK